MKYFAFFGLGFTGVIALLTACQYDPKTTEKRENHYADDAPVFVDHATGCEYLGYTGHGLTPRLIWDEKRQEITTKGCRIVEISK